MINDITLQDIPLPEDVLKLKLAGYYDQALCQIQVLMDSPRTPSILSRRLELERHVIKALVADQYPYTFEQARQIMVELLSVYEEGELEEYRRSGAADWMFVDGQVRFNRRFFGNLASTRKEVSARLKVQEDIEETLKDQALRDEQVRSMKEQGGRTARIRVHLGIKVKPEYERPGVPILIHLPIPLDDAQASGFKLLGHGDGLMQVSSSDCLQRTISFTAVHEAGREYWVEYEYVNHVPYVVPDKAKVSLDQPSFCLEEQAPHIVFTPYLKQLAYEIVGDEGNPLCKARLIYDFITTHVMYSYVRRYDTIDNLSEYAALNLKGDCGIQALLFITLCRLCGIPARWQSGLYVTPEEIGCHDWAQFYVEPYGWLFCDCSFGGGGWRNGKLDRWNHYFGNLDVLRLPASSAIQVALDPPKKHWRGDPIDNQRGEAEYEDQGLDCDQLEFCHRTLDFQWL